MTTNFYTNVECVGNNILYRGVKNGRRVNLKMKYSPKLFVPSNDISEWKTLDGQPLKPMSFDDIRDARSFVKRYTGVENFKIYGNQSYNYSYIADNFKGMVEWDFDLIKITILDIEVGSDNGFPDPYRADEPITAITLLDMNGKSITYACGSYVSKEDEIYHRCEDEHELCTQFLEYWSRNCPDVITGWNTNGFDIPYLYNRFTKILGQDEANKLSPWNMVTERKTFQKTTGKEIITYNIVGVGMLDYIDLYKAYAPAGKSQESYRLDYIASVEINENKISYEEFDNLHQLYRQNFQKFIEYNIYDCKLILKLDDKLKLLQLGLTLAYDTKSNYNDIFAQTRMWDALIYNYLIERKIVVPEKRVSEKDAAYEGAYVKEPLVGMHHWVASFDLNSLHPHLMMQYNLSPEMIVEPKDYTPQMRNILSQGVNVEKLLNKEVDLTELDRVTVTPNGQFFRTDKQGFLPEILEALYADRKKFKDMMIEEEKRYEIETDEEKKKDIEKLVAKYNNLQLAKKLALNSCYGATGSKYFRFYDLRIAEAVTLASQLSIKWIANKINKYFNSLLKTNSDYVIASDTDSVYIRFAELVNLVYKGEKETEKVIRFMDKVCKEKIEPYINDSYKELADYVNAYAQKMRMKREVLANKGIWTAKKRYVINVYNSEGVQYAKPKLKIIGLEMKKAASSPAFVRKKMTELVELIMNGDEDDVQKFIKEFEKEFKKCPVEDISFPRGVNNIKEYSDDVMMYKKGTPINVKASILYNHFIKRKNLDKKYPMIQEGEKIKFVYLKEPNPIRDAVIAYPNRLPEELGLHNYIDYDTMFDKTFLDPMKTILDCIGWKTKKVVTVDGFYE